MRLADFIKSDTAKMLLNEATSILQRAGAFEALFELGRIRNRPLVSDTPAESYALRAAFHDGYTAALDDIIYFNERYVHKPNAEASADFGALASLIDADIITKEEADELRKSGTK